jgi:hypothetical protein
LHDFAWIIFSISNNLRAIPNVKHRLFFNWKHTKDYFLQTYGIDRMFNLVNKLNGLQGSKDKKVLAAIEEFKADPIKVFREGFKEEVPGIKAAEINSRLDYLQPLQMCVGVAYGFGDGGCVPACLFRLVA